MHTPMHVNGPHDSEPPERFMRAGGAGEGRVGRGIDLLQRSWSYLCLYPRLLALPALSAMATAVAALLIFTPVLYLTRDWDGRLPILAASVVFAFPFTFISTFFNVGFLAMVQAFRRGEEPTVRSGLRFARQRWRTIAAWSLVSTLVGTALNALDQIPYVGQWLGRLLSVLGGLAWGLATLFVVPVLVIEDVGVRAAVRRSAGTFKNRWGEAVTGEIVIGAVFGLLTLPVVMVGLAAVAVYPDHLVTGATLLAVAVLSFGALVAASSALTELFQLSLYQYAADRSLTGPFTEADLESAIKPRKLAFWRR